MKFVSMVDKDKFELFALAAHVAGDVVVLKFGPEKITCNRICEDGGCLFSGEYIHTQSSIEQDTLFQVALSTCELKTYLAQMPSGGLSIGVDNVGDFIMVVGGFKMSITPITPCPDSDEVSKEDYPLIFNLDTSHFEALFTYIELNIETEVQSIILSREEDGIYFADPEWKNSVLIRDMDLFFEKSTAGKFSMMMDYKAFKNIITTMSIYTSVKIAFGEDMPFIILGYDEQVRLAYMIAPQVDEEEENDRSS